MPGYLPQEFKRGITELQTDGQYVSPTIGRVLGRLACTKAGDSFLEETSALFANASWVISRVSGAESGTVSSEVECAVGPSTPGAGGGCSGTSGGWMVTLSVRMSMSGAEGFTRELVSESAIWCSFGYRLLLFWTVPTFLRLLLQILWLELDLRSLMPIDLTEELDQSADEVRRL